MRRALTTICVLVLTSCIDGGECTDFCDTYLDVQVDGIAPAEAPLELQVCDGAYCDTFHLDHDECEFQEPTADPGFNACFTDGAVNIRRLFMVRNNFLPLPNDTVTLRIASSSGDELLNEMGVPAVVDAMSCVEECTAREIRF